MTTTYTAQQVLTAAAQGLSLGAAAIVDSSSNVLADLDQLEPIAAAGEIGSVTFTDSPALAIDLAGTQAASDLDVIKLFQGNSSLNIGYATVAQAAQIAAALPHASIMIQDEATAIFPALDQLQSIAGNLTEIFINPIQGPSEITLTQAQVAADPAAVALLVSPEGGHLGTFGVALTVSGTLTIEQAVTDEALSGYISGLTVVDSAANIEAALATLVTRPESLDIANAVPNQTPYQFASITLTDSGTPTIVAPFSQAQMQDITDILSAVTTPHAVDWTGVPVADVATLLNAVKPATETSIQVDIQDTAANVASVIDYLEPYDLAGQIRSITLTDGTLPVFTAAQSTVDASVISKIIVSGLTAAAAIADAGDLQSLHGVAVQDGAASVSGQIDGLESIAAAGKLVSVTLTDSGVPTIAVTTTQASADTAAFGAIAGSFTVVQTASGSSESITGVSNAVGNTVVFTDSAASYTITADGNGTGFTVSEPGMADHLSGIQALQFGDFTEIVASQTAVGGEAVTSAQVTTLYAAVFAREPDVPGLGFYEAYAKANPGVGIVAYGQYFLSSAEYTANSAHNYAQSEAGETQFITDTYSNLLGRAPEAGAVAFYEGVIDPMLSNLTPGTAAYSQALLVARATVLAYFSQSPEFLADVTATAQNPASAQHWLQLV